MKDAAIMMVSASFYKFPLYVDLSVWCCRCLMKFSVYK